MFAHVFRFDQHAFQSRMRQTFEPRKPRHPLLRVAVGLIGLAVLAVLVMFSVVIGAAMIAVGVVYKLWHARGQSVARKSDTRDAGVLEADYRVVDKDSPPPR